MLKRLANYLYSMLSLDWQRFLTSSFRLLKSFFKVVKWFVLMGFSPYESNNNIWLKGLLTSISFAIAFYYKSISDKVMNLFNIDKLKSSFAVNTKVGIDLAIEQMLIHIQNKYYDVNKSYEENDPIKLTIAFLANLKAQNKDIHITY